MSQGDLARIMGLPYEQVEAWGAGINHFQCPLAIRDRATGDDLYPLLRSREAHYDPGFAPLSRRLLRAFGYWMTCSDEHFGEYLPTVGRAAKKATISPPTNVRGPISPPRSIACLVGRRSHAIG